MSIFSCASCQSKDAHIQSLVHQIQTLEKLVFPTRPTQDITLEEAEHDVLFESKIITPEDEVGMEAGRLMSGDYDRIPEDF